MTTKAAQRGEWFDAYAARLVLYVRQWLPAAAAQDTIQEVFLKLATQPVPGDVKAWLFTRRPKFRHQPATFAAAQEPA